MNNPGYYHVVISESRLHVSDKPKGNLGATTAEDFVS